MTDHPPDSQMDDFLSLSREYAEALEALGTIEKQAESIVALGGREELGGYVGQFLAMSRRAGERARECELQEIAGWFDDLTLRASRIRTALLAD